MRNFDRFAKAVLPAQSPVDDRIALRVTLLSIASQRTQYNARNLPQQNQSPFGPGRVDAFVCNFQRGVCHVLGIPGNVKPADAPVSYPCLWDAPQHDRVQWNGAAENKVTPLGSYCLEHPRWAHWGETLASAGGLRKRRYQCARAVDSATLSLDGEADQPMQIEGTLKTLWSPEWPAAELGPIDADRRGKGELLFRPHCIECHKTERPDVTPIVGSSPRVECRNRSQHDSELRRTAKTGKLQGRRKTLLGRERFAETEPTAVILKPCCRASDTQTDVNLATIKSSLAGRQVDRI